MCSLDTSVLNNNTLQALCCAGLISECVAICPNPDLGGIGVRIAFYLQSALNALLVAFSPPDSVPTAWAGTLLTLALVIAAMVSKLNDSLTLHHATLVLNFATLSTISSLAVAPMLPIWRLTPAQYYERHREQHALLHAEEDDPNHDIIASSMYTNLQKRQVKAAQKRARTVLSAVLLLQVVLQWAWGIFLFVSPSYSQEVCNGSTTLIMFMAPFETNNINDFDNNGARFLVWPAWLLFSLGITLWLTINLANTSSERAQAIIHTATSGSLPVSNTPAVQQWGKLIMQSLPTEKPTRSKVFVFVSNLVSLGLWAVYIAASEWQKSSNCIFDGEDDFAGLGQITAIFLSIAPFWSLSIALYKYPMLRRRRLRHQQTDAESQRRRPQSMAEPHETEALLLARSPPARPIHMPMPSDVTLHPDYEAYEMQAYGSPSSSPGAGPSKSSLQDIDGDSSESDDVSARPAFT